MRAQDIVKQVLLLFLAVLVIATIYSVALRVRTAYGASETVPRKVYRMAVSGQVDRFKNAAQTIRRLRAENRRMRRRFVPNVRHAIRLASVVYQQSERDLLRVATCETGGTLSPYAKNRTSTASGLFQFLYPSTWNRTPFAEFSVWDPYANALAAGWMWQQGNKGEWVCR